jgi:glutamate dehydrogenase (NAD(P)+)
MIVEELRDPSTGLEAALVVMRSEGLAFGGTRFSAQCTVKEVQDLARCMDKKLAGHTQKIHGAKAGFFCAPDDPGLPALMALAADQWRPFLEKRVVLGKDMGASNELLDRFYACVGQAQLAPVQGPGVPRYLREFEGYRSHMTGQGVCWALSSFFGGSLSGIRVAIQGFGAVGLGSAIRLTRAGAVVVGLSDVKGAFFFEVPPNEEALIAMAQRGGCSPHPEGPVLPRERLFSMDVDAVVLAADSHSVSENDAATVCAKVVVEGSNFGLCPAARARLLHGAIPVIPDFIASSASAAMVALQMEAGGAMSEGHLWQRIEASIRSQTEDLVPDR